MLSFDISNVTLSQIQEWTKHLQIFSLTPSPLSCFGYTKCWRALQKGGRLTRTLEPSSSSHRTLSIHTALSTSGFKVEGAVLKKLLLRKCLGSLLIRRVAWGTILFTACAWGSESQYVWPAESEPQLLRLNKASLWCLLSLLASMALQDLTILHFTESPCTSLTALYCCLLQTPLLTVLSCCR